MRYQGTGAEISTLDKSSKIDVLIGPYRSGKTWYLLEQAVEHCINHPFEGATIVVPSQRYRALLDERIVQLFRRKFGRSDTGESSSERAGFIGLKIQTFYQFCQTILMRLGSFNLTLPDAVRPALLARILKQRKAGGQLQALASIAEFRGTPLAILSLIDELERAALSPEQVIMHLQKSLATHSRYMELAQLYKDFWQCLDAIKQVDRRRMVFKLLQALSDQDSSASLSLIAFDGFDRFNPLQLKTIQELSRHAQKLLVSFDYLFPEEDTQQNYSWKKNSYAQLSAILADKVIFKQISAQLDSASQLSKPDKLLTEQFVASDRYFEMNQIAAQIKESVINQSRKLRDLLVVARSIKPYRSAIQSAFQDAGLEYFVDETIELRALPVVQFIMSVISLYRREFPRAEVIAALRSRYFASKFRLSEAELQELDTISLTHMVVGGKEQWQEALAHSSIGRLTSKLEAIFTILMPPHLDGIAEEYVTWVEDVLEKVLALPGADDHLDPFEHWEQDSALAQFRKSLAVLIQEQYALNALGEKGKHSFESLFGKLEKLIEGANFRRQPRTKDYVLITDADLAPNRIFDEIYIAGLVEGEFPQRAHQSGFTTVDEVETWSRFGVDIHNPRFDPNYETALFRSLEQRARKRLVLSSPQNEMSGEELTPSFFLKSTDSHLATKLPLAHPLEDCLVKPNSARNAIAAYLWSGKSLNLPTPLLNSQPLAEFAENLNEALSVALGRTRNTRASVLNGYLADFVAGGSLRVSLPEYWSASRLSDYGKCPFRYWVSHVVAVKPVEEPEPTLTTNVIGETYHLALELFYKELIARNLTLKESNEELVGKIFEKAVAAALAWLSNNPKVRKGEFWQYECKELEFRLKRFLQSERERAWHEDFVPLLVEASFGMAEEEGNSLAAATNSGPALAPPLSLKNGDNEILIRGRIDRIDVNRSGAEKSIRIIDYKSGSTRITKDDILSGRNLQLPLYALAVQRAIIPGSKVIEGQFLSIAQADSIGKFKFDKYEETDEAEEQTLSERAETLTKRFVNAIEQGDFSVRPNGPTVCSNCDHMMICRIRELDTTERDEDESD